LSIVLLLLLMWITISVLLWWSAITLLRWGRIGRMSAIRIVALVVVPRGRGPILLLWGRRLIGIMLVLALRGVLLMSLIPLVMGRLAILLLRLAVSLVAIPMLLWWWASMLRWCTSILLLAVAGSVATVIASAGHGLWYK